MGDARLRPAVLVISDTASKDPSTDKAGNVLTDTFSADGGDQWRPPLVQIVPDSIIEIQRTVQQWSDSEGYFNLIITTGGTGFAVKDVTPEVGHSVFLLRYNLS
jgi:gephyrin